MSSVDLKDLHVAIAGGGVGGLCAAIALRRHGASVRVFERRAEPATLGAGVVLWPNAMRVLAELDLAEPVGSAGGRLRAMRRLTSRGQPLGELDLRRLGQRMAAPCVPIARAALQGILLDRLASLGVEVEYGVRVRGVESGGRSARLLFDHQDPVEANLVIGADGRMASVCRAFVSGDATPLYQGYVNWIGVARGAAFDPGAVLDFWGVGERFGLVPLSSSAAYWAGCKALPSGLGAPALGDRAELSRLFASWPDPIPAVLASTSNDSIRRIEVYDHDPLAQWHRGRVVLLGDAAHAALPTSGQGACQAIEDAWQLASSLRAGDVAAAFADYEARRIPKSSSVIEVGRRLARSLFDEDPVRCASRDAAARHASGEDAVDGMARFWGSGLPPSPSR